MGGLGGSLYVTPEQYAHAQLAEQSSSLPGALGATQLSSTVGSGTSTWGGAIEIQAACNLWKSRIVVHDLRDRGKRASIEFVSCDAAISGATELTMELEWTGGHYEPVRK